jgi:glutathione S-transferase
MRLYYHPLSSNARRVLMTARHLGIDLELVQVDLAQGAQNRPEFLKLNPNHRVPVLEHDGFVLWESYAIMQYLADLTPGQTLYPTELKARADVNRWLFWCGQDFMPGAAILNWENAIKPRFGIGPTDATEVARGERLMTAAAKVLDAHLADADWLCPNGPTLADFAIAAPIGNQETGKYPLGAFANLQRWHAQVRALKAWEASQPQP